jgi:three-Cys-motif partner protein
LVDEKPDGKGVGPWVPKDKHRLLTDYLHGTRHAWKAFPKRVLIDPFCGPGRIRVAGESGTRDGGAIAAWREMHNDTTSFTDVFVGDLDPKKSAACAERLQALGATVRAFMGPAVETVPQMVAAAPRGALCMAYIDPYCLTLLDFEMLRTLSTLKVDLAVHFSTMDLQR